MSRGFRLTGNNGWEGDQFPLLSLYWLHLFRKVSANTQYKKTSLNGITKGIAVSQYPLLGIDSETYFATTSSPQTHTHVEGAPEHQCQQEAANRGLTPPFLD